jgi:hypothetical protein
MGCKGLLQKQANGAAVAVPMQGGPRLGKGEGKEYGNQCDVLCRITPPNQQAADHLGVNWVEHETNI